MFVDNRILNNVVRYAQQNLQAQSKDHSTWTEVTLQELKEFLRLLIAMSIHRLPSTWNYWSTDWVLGLPAFAKVIPRNRFLEIGSNLRLADNSKMPRPGEKNFEKLYKMQQFLEDLKANFYVNYNPHCQ